MAGVTSRSSGTSGREEGGVEGEGGDGGEVRRRGTTGRVKGRG